MDWGSIFTLIILAALLVMAVSRKSMRDSRRVWVERGQRQAIIEKLRQPWARVLLPLLLEKEEVERFPSLPVSRQERVLLDRLGGLDDEHIERLEELLAKLDAERGRN